MNSIQNCFFKFEDFGVILYRIQEMENKDKSKGVCLKFYYNNEFDSHLNSFEKVMNERTFAICARSDYVGAILLQIAHSVYTKNTNMDGFNEGVQDYIEEHPLKQKEDFIEWKMQFLYNQQVDMMEVIDDGHPYTKQFWFADDVFVHYSKLKTA